MINNILILYYFYIIIYFVIEISYFNFMGKSYFFSKIRIISGRSFS